MSNIARLAVSKAAGFGYAVVVAVAGNVAFNFVEHHQAIVAPIVANIGQPATAPTAAGVATIAAKPALAPVQPAAGHRAPVVSVLPEPPAAALPAAATLPAPALTPTALAPSPRAAAIPPTAQPAALLSLPAPPAPVRSATLSVSVIRTQPASAAPAAGESAPALPPLGPAVVVATPPTPPAAALPIAPKRLTPAPIRAAAAPASVPAVPNDKPMWNLTDVWHPGRAVRKGLDWAADQLPSGDAAPPRFPSTTPPAQPIPLVPSANALAEGGKSDAAAAPRSAKPGPGSGGLY